MTTAKRFFACIGLGLGVLCVFNVILAVKVDSVSNLILRRMRTVPRIDTLFLGNSLMASGLDPGVFASARPASPFGPAVFNAGLGSSSPVEHYLMADQAYLHHDSIPCLVYGFYDLQLTKPESFGWADLVGNRSMGYSTEPGTAASLYAPGSRLERWRFYLTGAVPMLREHSQLWKYVEMARRYLQEVGMPKAGTNQFGRIADFEAVAAPDQAAFEMNCEAAVHDSSPLVPAVEALLKLASEHHTKVIVVEMPMTSQHRNRYYSTEAWRQYREYLRRRLLAAGATYALASDWVQADTLFSDGLHLNAAGANVFSNKMAGFMAAAFTPH